MLKRFNKVSLSLKGYGFVNGFVTALLAKKFGKVLAKKIVAKVSAKTATKLGMAGGGFVTGAEMGIFCGPFSWICSPVAGLIGGIVGWVTVDKIIIELDQFFNEDEFRNELTNMIAAEEERTKEILIDVYVENLQEIKNRSVANLEEVKNKRIIDIVVQNDNRSDIEKK
jgi:hypothetical protein